MSCFKKFEGHATLIYEFWPEQKVTTNGDTLKVFPEKEPAKRDFHAHARNQSRDNNSEGGEEEEEH